MERKKEKRKENSSTKNWCICRIIHCQFYEEKNKGIIIDLRI
jgi:hypothetical protein